MTTQHRAELRRVLPWALLLLYAACCVLYCADPWWRPDWDGAVYLLTGKSLAEGHGYAYLDRPFFLRPPGLPYLFSFFLEGGRFDFAAINLALLSFAGLAVAMIYLALRPLHGAWIALSVALLTGTSSLFTHFFNHALAEYPYFTLFFLGLILYQASLRDCSRWWLLALSGGVFMAAAFYLRTTAALVLPAVLLLSVLRGMGRRRFSGLLLCAVVGLLALPWFTYSRDAASRAIVPVEQEVQLDYATALLHEDPGDPGSPRVSPETLLRRVRQNGSLLMDELVMTTFHVEEAGIWFRLLLVVAVLCGLSICLRRGHLVYEWLTAVSCLVVVAYFAYGSRLLVPLVPMVYLYVAVCLSAVGGAAARALRRPWLKTGIWGVAFAALLLSNAPNFRAHMLVPEDPTPTYRQLAKWIEQNTPPDAVLLCNQAPTLSLLSRRTAYTYRFPRSADLLATYEPDFVILDGPQPSGLLPLVTSRTVRRHLVTLDSGARIPVYELARDR
ncbi:MAG: glycosyltransferase family 39 protein [Planctomycetota bacterium]